MIDKYYLFKNELGISYIIGPEGFNNNSEHAFSNLKGWKFYGANRQTYFITSHKEILAYFSEGDALVELLVKNDVAIEEMEIKELEHVGHIPSITFTNGASLTISVGDSSYTICTLRDKDSVKLFDYPLDKGFNHKVYQEIGEFKFKKMDDHLYKSKVKLVIEGSPDKNGNPPEWLNLRKGREQDFQLNQNLKLVVAVVVCLIFLILMFNYS